MKFEFVKKFSVLILAGLAIWIWRVPLYAVYLQTSVVLFPCRQTITYRLGNIDPQFGLSTTTALADMKEAAQLWSSERKGLLIYDPAHGTVVIDFEYDTRQETTQKLRRLGVAVSGDRASYDALKAKYNELSADYSRKKASFEWANEALQKEAAQYESDVAYWNARDGAPRDVHDELQTQKTRLTEEQSQLRQSQAAINAQVDTINTMVVSLNDMAKSLNLDVAAYNTIGNGAGSEFEQGVYESSLGKRTITIFEYENHTKLVRVLAHEMGHAIGLDHVGDSRAIMAALNEGTKIALTAGDVEELDRVCAQNPFSILKTKLSDYLSLVSGDEER